VAARVGSGSWTGTKQDGAGQSVAAWSAVRGWQETARSTSRSGAKPSKSGDGSRPVKAASADQEALAFEAEATPEATTPEVTTTPEAATTATTAQETPKVEIKRQGNRKTGAKRGGNGRKVAGRSTQPGGQARRTGQS
jgi:hypothetical protein